ncbi:MAG: GUN4 N-terminal ARM-like repeat domain-containing protein [Leptolyngbyaceae cyanobacterium bins.349]|nr:GUN4 N-terminal ARM-like repeat domain-containing protein [Leptolyngbyaceae cyanobacterium bins.349]
MNSFTNSLDSTENTNLSDRTSELLTRLKSTPDKNLSLVIDELAHDQAGQTALMYFLQERCAPSPAANASSPPVDLIAGKIYQTLFQAASPACADFLQTHFPTGIVPLRSQQSVDYQPLQILLAKQDFQAADQLTLQKLCELAGEVAVQRNWIYFTEVEQFPAIDLQTINALWLIHSEGKFGFSVQRELWLSLGKNWDKLWPKIGWKDGINWTRYPQGFTWDLTAPKGHLPLSNQLRGVRAMASLMAHPAWEQP